MSWITDIMLRPHTVDTVSVGTGWSRTLKSTGWSWEEKVMMGSLMHGLTLRSLAFWIRSNLTVKQHLKKIPPAFHLIAWRIQPEPTLWNPRHTESTEHFFYHSKLFLYCNLLFYFCQRVFNCRNVHISMPSLTTTKKNVSTSFITFNFI